jgi:hypothetical protein
MILRRQSLWASSHGIPTEAGYCLAAEQNLPWLSKQIRADMNEGDGNEFGPHGERGKICALHSSSALAINVFGYWQTRDRGPLVKALGLTSVIQDVRFERKFETGVPPRSPNLDVVLSLADGSILAIESKFTEWHGASGGKPLRDAYVSGKAKRWADVGLMGAQMAAETYLDAPKRLRISASMSR